MGSRFPLCQAYCFYCSNFLQLSSGHRDGWMHKRAFPWRLLPRVLTIQGFCHLRKGKRNQKLMTYFNNAKRLHKPVSLSLDLEAYEGRLWSVLQADSQDKLTHEEVQSLAETWGMIAAGGFIREMQETRILVPDGELMVFLGNEGLDYFVCPEEVLKGTAHTLKPALDVAIYSEAYFPERSYQGAKLRLPAEPAFLKDAKMRAFIHENEPYRIELLGNWPSFLKNILEKAASVTLEEVNVLACLVTHMDSSQIESY